MNQLFEKLTSYNLFNYLLPGVVFVALSDALTDYKLIQDDVVIGLFLYYFIGLTISRIGSILVEPLFKKTGFVKFSEYHDYVRSSEKDKLIPILSESNNMYRTFVSTFLCLLALIGLEFLGNSYPILNDMLPLSVASGMLVLFSLSYRKQTKYISSRVSTAKTED